MHRPSTAALLLCVLALTACDEPSRPTMSLYRAVRVGDLDQVKRHLAWNTDLNEPDVNGDCPLHVAARIGAVGLGRDLIAHGANPLGLNAADETPLRTALANGRTQFALMLVRKGVSLDAQQELIALVRVGLSDRDVIEFLMRHGADPNRPDEHGDLLLHLAIRSGSLSLVTRLVAYGADVNRADRLGRLPLDLAAERIEDKSPDGARISALLQRNGARAIEPAAPSGE